MSQNGTLCTKYVSWDVTSFGLVNNYRHFEYKCQTTRRYISEGLNILYTAAIVFKLEKRHVSVFLYNVHPVEPVGAPPPLTLQASNFPLCLQSRNSDYI